VTDRPHPSDPLDNVTDEIRATTGPVFKMLPQTDLSLARARYLRLSEILAEADDAER